MSLAVKPKPMTATRSTHEHGAVSYPKRPEEVRATSYTPSIAASEAPTEADLLEETVSQLELHSDFHYVRTAESSNGSDDASVTAVAQQPAILSQTTTARREAALGYSMSQGNNSTSIPVDGNEPKEVSKATYSTAERTESANTFSAHLPTISSVLCAVAKGLVLSTAGRMLYPVT